ncbi:hypothetical protein GIB67_026323, partial [Kingdonia uniflora]
LACADFAAAATASPRLLYPAGDFPSPINPTLFDPNPGTLRIVDCPAFPVKSSSTETSPNKPPKCVSNFLKIEFSNLEF